MRGSVGALPRPATMLTKNPKGFKGSIKSLSPTTAGIYTFTAVSSLTLAPNKNYCIVLTGGTGIGDGAYELNYTGATSNMINNDWVGLQSITISTNGVNTRPISSYKLAYDNLAQFAINATVIPEPSLLGLLGLGGLTFLWHRRKAKAV